MELFKNTNFDFLGWKWPFIGASLVLWAAGMISLAVKGGPKYGIDFRGGAEMRLRFANEPPMARLRTVLDAKVPGSSIQQLSGAPEVEVTTPNTNEQELNATRDLIEKTLREEFGGGAGDKLDVNNSSVEQLQNTLRDALLQANVSLSEQQLQDMVKDIQDYRNSKGGLLRSFDELSAVKTVTPPVIEALKNKAVLGQFTIRSTDVVGPKVGADLQKQAIQATLFALGGMLVYIWFRFEWVYGLGAVIAVFHDTLITLGLFSLLNKELSLTVVAALLTLVGYSMNDTIVVFDRIRENLKNMRREKLDSVINISVNQTLSRTVLTSGLTFITALSLWLFGGEVLNGFSLALVIGILIGTYSSVYVASPIVLGLHNLVESRRKGAPPAPETKTASAKQPAPRPAGGKKAVRG